MEVFSGAGMEIYSIAHGNEPKPVPQHIFVVYI